MIEPAWLIEARRHIGLREIPGKKTNGTIGKWLILLKAWWSDDETPWCGTFVAYCFATVGLPTAKHWYRAKAWAEWGKPVGHVVGAVAIFGRAGGGHVGFLVGKSAGGWVYVLGGNQSNGVTIMKLHDSRLIATRWPVNVATILRPLPDMSGGTVSEDEA